MRALLLAALLLLVAAPAWAGWTRTEAGTGTDCEKVAGGSPPLPGDVCFYNVSTAVDSPLLLINWCDYVDVFFDGDIASTSDGGTAYIMTSVSATLSTNTSERVLSDAGNVTLNGDGTVGRAAIYDIRGWQLWMDLVAAATATRTVVVCH